MCAHNEKSGVRILISGLFTTTNTLELDLLLVKNINAR